VDSGGPRGFQRLEEVFGYPTHPPKNLQLYISGTSNVVSTCIIIERGSRTIPSRSNIQSTSSAKVLSDSKTWYFHIMKLSYALLIMSRKLSHYFQVHQIEVHTLWTLGKILSNREATGKIANWAIELSMYDITYKPIATIKTKALSEFMVEWTETQTPPKERELDYWTINFDGSLQVQGTEAEILVTSPKEESFKYVLQMHFPSSNNAVEYEALLHGLRMAMALGICRVKVLGDSLLVVNQANKEWSCLDDKMLLYCEEHHKLENNFDYLEYLHILRGKNEISNELAKLGSSQPSHLKSSKFTHIGVSRS
jgi:ribonuclease HI